MRSLGYPIIVLSSKQQVVRLRLAWVFDCNGQRHRLRAEESAIVKKELVDGLPLLELSVIMAAPSPEDSSI